MIATIVDEDDGALVSGADVVSVLLTVGAVMDAVARVSDNRPYARLAHAEVDTPVLRTRDASISGGCGRRDQTYRKHECGYERELLHHLSNSLLVGEPRFSLVSIASSLRNSRPFERKTEPVRASTAFLSV